jgi:hypothetical protein
MIYRSKGKKNSMPTKAQGNDFSPLRSAQCPSCGSKALIRHGTYRLTPFTKAQNSVLLVGVDCLNCDSCNEHDPIIPHVANLIEVANSKPDAAVFIYDPIIRRWGILDKT